MARRGRSGPSGTVRVRLDIPQSFIGDVENAATRNLANVCSDVGDEIVEEARRLSAERLNNNRPASRRRTNRPHYIDSFEVGAPDTGAGRARVVVRNNSPHANIIEGGTAGHDIEGPGAFPFATTTDGGGQYDVEADPYVVYGGPRPAVNHPPTKAYRILGDARDNVRSRFGDKVKMKVRVALKR